LAANAMPIRILHISDLHIERLTRREDKLLTLVEQAQADLILITGDYLNLSYVRDPRAQADVQLLLSQLSAPFGVYAVMGSPTVDARDEIPGLFDDLSVRLLRNEWQELDLGDGRQLVLLGLDCSHYLPTDGRRLSELVAQSPNTAPRILLYHAPDLMPEASELGVDLYLCGHTHGGQVRLPLYGAMLTSSQLGKRYEMGYYQHGRTNLYVSRGVGLEGLGAPRIRFLAPPEITLVTLQGKS
jgi:predicted MPP superfamily phosphohydrolase